MRRRSDVLRPQPAAPTAAMDRPVTLPFSSRPDRRCSFPPANLVTAHAICEGYIGTRAPGDSGCQGLLD